MIGFIKKILGGESDANLQDKILDGGYLVDVRSPKEFDNGHVKGSVNIPVDRIEYSLEKLADKKNIIVFCRSGARSSRAKSILKKNGFTNVTNGGTWNHINNIVKTIYT